MSNHPIFIKNLAISINCKSYLELGLYEGETFNLVSEVVNNCVGVDIIKKCNNKKGKILITTTDLFFTNNNETFDLIFIDADHNFDQVKKDFNNCEKILNKFGVILLHDTDPSDIKYIQPGYCGDSYKIIDYIYSLEKYNIITLPISDPGLSIVMRKEDRRILEKL